MERKNVTENRMTISKPSNLSKLHVQDVCCVYRLSEYFVNYIYCALRFHFPQRHAVMNIAEGRQHIEEQCGLRGSTLCFSPVCNDQRCVNLCEHSVLASQTPSFPALRFQHNKYTTDVGKVILLLISLFVSVLLYFLLPTSYIEKQ